MNTDYQDIDSKDPGPEGPALVHPGGVICMVTFASGDKVSGFRCQQPKSTFWIGVAHEMDFLSPVLAFSCNSISIQGSGLDFY